MVTHFSKVAVAGQSVFDRWFLTFVVLAAIVVRIAAIAMVTGLSTPPTFQSDDSEYDVYAWNLAQGRGYRGQSIDVTDRDHLTAYRPPVPSLCFAAVYMIFGHSYPAARILNAIFGGLTVLLIERIGRSCFDVRVARIAATLFAFSPSAIYFSQGLLSEPLAAFQVALVVWCSLGIRSPRGWVWAILTGVTFGLLLLNKPGFLFVLPFLPFWALVVCGRNWNLWRRITTIPLALGLTCLPWIVRNLIVMHAFIPFGTGGGQLLLSTCNRIVVNDPELYGYSVMDSFLPEYQTALRAPDNEIARDAVAKSLGVAWLKANPDQWFYLVRMKFLRFWEPWLHRPVRSLGVRAAEGYLMLILIFMVGALPAVTTRFFREQNPALLIQAMFAGNTVMAMIFHGQPRYRFPIESLCLLLASGGLVAAFDFLRADHRTARAKVLFQKTGIFGSVVIVLVVIFTAASKFDDTRVEKYRTKGCELRLDAIAHAVAIYQQSEGGMPASLESLIPQYLPNVDHLHCPKHSLDWHDYESLTETDPYHFGHLAISYQLEVDPQVAGRYHVIETEARHPGGRLSRSLSPVPPSRHER